MGDEKDKAKAKRLILARRARFVAAALASVTATSTAAVLAGSTEACGGATAQDIPTGDDPKPQVCLSPPKNPQPQPCLSQVLDAGPSDDAGNPKDGSSDARLVKDADPLPCLSPPLRDE
jgi:hypothetical protein